MTPHISLDFSLFHTAVEVMATLAFALSGMLEAARYRWGLRGRGNDRSAHGGVQPIRAVIARLRPCRPH